MTLCQFVSGEFTWYIEIDRSNGPLDRCQPQEFLVASVWFPGAEVFPKLDAQIHGVLAHWEGLCPSFPDSKPSVPFTLPFAVRRSPQLWENWPRMIDWWSRQHLDKTWQSSVDVRRCDTFFWKTLVNMLSSRLVISIISSYFLCLKHLEKIGETWWNPRLHLPSGSLLYSNYWKSPFLMWKLTINGHFPDFPLLC